MNQLSDKGAVFIARHEGFRSVAYLDAVGVLTIGTGFTNRSRVFRSYWEKTRGRKLVAGDEISRHESEQLLKTVADAEYGAAVTKAFGAGLPQHVYDACTSVCFNLGPGAVKWRWAAPLAQKDYFGAAELLRRGYNKAAGRVLRGLTRRRGEEADLLARGDYGGGHKSEGYDLHAYQARLKQQGFDTGPLDGQWGTKTASAVRAFQQRHPYLKADGVLGPATRTALDESPMKQKGAGGLVSGALGGASFAGLGWNASAWLQSLKDNALTWVLIPLVIVAVLGLAWITWRLRSEILFAIRAWLIPR